MKQKEQLDRKRLRASKASHSTRKVTHHVHENSLMELCQLKDGTYRFFYRQPNGTISDRSSFTKGSVRFEPLADPIVTDGHVSLPPRPHHESQDTLALFRGLMAFLRQHVTWSPEFLVAATAYILGTWVSERFEFFPYLQFSGAPGTGKTRSLDVLAAVCYHSAKLSSITGPLIFRLVSKYHPTLLIDEVDTEFRSELRGILREGTGRGGKVLRCVGDDYHPESYSCYGPKVYAGQEPITDAALASRCIQENMAIQSPEPHIGPSLPESFGRDSRELQARLLRWALDNFGTIEIHDPCGPDLRLRQVFLPLFTVTPPEFHEQLKTLMERQRFAARRSMTDSLDGAVVAAINAIGSPEVIRPSEIAVAVCEARGVDPEDARSPEHVSAAKVGHALKRLGILDSDRDAQGMIYRVNPGLLDRLYQTYLPEYPPDGESNAVGSEGNENASEPRRAEAKRRAGDLTHAARLTTEVTECLRTLSSPVGGRASDGDSLRDPASQVDVGLSASGSPLKPKQVELC